VVVEFGDQIRKRIAVPVQLALAVVVLAYVLALSVVGGALLARYLLPVIPLWILLCVSTLRRRVYFWRAIVAVVALSFGLALVFPAPYRISPEDTLAYRDFVELHQAAAHELEQLRIPGPLLTAWPATDELSRPFLGYVSQPISNIAVEDFSRVELTQAINKQEWNAALVFSTKYDPPGGSLLDRIGWWRRAHERWFGYHEDLTPEEAAQALHARILWREARGTQWAAILARE
jgi:hypothetical protein